MTDIWRTKHLGTAIVMAILLVSGSGKANDIEDIDFLLGEARSYSALLARMNGSSKPNNSRFRGERVESYVSAPFPYADPIHRAAAQYRVPALLIAAVIRCESGWDPRARSSAGARGLMQVLPRTAKGEFGINAHSLWDPVINIHVGAAYLRLLANRYPGRTPDVIAAYNAGPGRLERSASLPRETRQYRRCVSRWHALYAHGADIRSRARKNGAAR